MDVSPFATEMTSMDYIDYFFELEERMKAGALNKQQYLYKGINAGLLAQINETLYIRSINGGKNNIRLQSNCELTNASFAHNKISLDFTHRETQAAFQHTTETVIAATGFHYQLPSFIQPIKEYINWTGNHQYVVKRNYSIDNNNSIFVQNAELHTHGFNTADLGMGPYRNAIIINTILRKPHFSFESNTAFQQFKAV
jgi:lysine N6-hydroxylase